MPSGPSLSFNGSFADPVKALHTMDPAYSMMWRINQSPAQQVAQQQLNQQGFYPSKNNRADFFGGEYPATIALAPTNAPGCAGYYNNTAGPCACNTCCAGQIKTPWSELARRSSCTHCTTARDAFVAGRGDTTGMLQDPRKSQNARHGGIANLSRQQVRQFDVSLTNRSF